MVAIGCVSNRTEINFKVPLLLNRQLYMDGLLFLDGTVLVTVEMYRCAQPHYQSYMYIVVPQMTCGLEMININATAENML